jgi:hypothetical protein
MNAIEIEINKNAHKNDNYTRKVDNHAHHGHCCSYCEVFHAFKKLFYDVADDKKYVRTKDAWVEVIEYLKSNNFLVLANLEAHETDVNAHEDIRLAIEQLSEDLSNINLDVSIEEITTEEINEITDN